MFETVYRYVFGASAIFVGCYVFYVYWRIYKLYKHAGGCVERIGLFWFSFYVQTPHFGGGAKILEGLPQDIQTQAASIRLRQGREHIAIVLWFVFLVLLASLVKRFSQG